MKRHILLCLFCALTSLAEDEHGSEKAKTIESPSPAAPATLSPTSSDFFDTKQDFHETPSFTVDVLIVSLPGEALQKLLPDLRDPKTVADAQAKLLSMVDRKDATLIDWLACTTHEGTVGRSETITEKRYAIEFAFPENSAGEKSEKASPNSDLAPPASFETRNLGTSLAVQGALAPDLKRATIKIDARAVDFARLDSFVVAKDSKAADVTVTQPIVKNLHAQTILTLKDGERRLIYSGKLTDARELGHVFIAGLRINPHD